MGCAGLRRGERDAEDRVGSEARLVLRSVELDQRQVQGSLVFGVEPGTGAGDLPLDIADGVENALAAIRPLVAVAQLDGLELPGGRAGGHRSTPGRTRLE